MKLTSPDFKENEPIPKECTCEGADESPALVVSDVPQKTKSLALIVEDPDAPQGTFTHWVLFNLPPSQLTLEKNLLHSKTLANGAQQGVNDFDGIGYGGPCPPSGSHRYFFKLYALDTDLNIPEEKVTKERLLKEMKDHVLADARLVGIYQKSGPEKREKTDRDWQIEEASEESFPASDSPAW